MPWPVVAILVFAVAAFLSTFGWMYYILLFMPDEDFLRFMGTEQDESGEWGEPE